MVAPLIKNLTIVVDGTERSYEVTNARFVARDTEQGIITFERARAGGAKTWFLEGTALQDPGDPESLWRLVFDNSGTKKTVVLAPYGAADVSFVEGDDTPTSSASTPTFTAVVTLRMEGDTFVLGGEATIDDNEGTWDFSFPADAKPVMVTT